MNLKQSFSENKIIGGIIIALVGLVFSWGIWSTTSHFNSSAELKLFCEKEKQIGEKVDDLKKDVKDVKEESKEQNKQINKNQEEMLKLLIDIQKQIKQQGR